MKVEVVKNFGVLKSKIPEHLKQLLLEESKTANNIDNEFKSGVTYPGVTKHYYVNNSFKELEKFIINMQYEYEKTFPGLSDVGVFNDDVPFELTKAWFNYQHKGEFIPQHTHTGIYSYNIWLQIPYKYEEEVVKNGKNVTEDLLRCFELTYLTVDGKFKFHNIPLSKEDEGTIIMFPSRLPHIVYPFYSTEGTRISVAGNIMFRVNNAR